MTRTSQTRNQFETQLSGTLAAGSFVMAVDSTAGFEIDEPIYLVIDPDVPASREWVRVISITGNTFNIDPSPNDHGSDGRNLAGSVGDIEHTSGAKVRSVTTEQILIDIFQDLFDITDPSSPSSLPTHIADATDPHLAAGYLVVDDTDALYVQLSGSTLDSAAQIKSDTNPIALDDLSRKGYVDDRDNILLPLDGSRSMTGANPLDVGTAKVINVVAGSDPADAVRFDQLVTDHGGLSGLTDDDHTQYHTDARALTWLGLQSTTDLPEGTNLYYTETRANNAADARIQLADLADLNTKPHSALTGVGTSDHHVKYTNGEAVAAVAAADDYVKLVGDVMSGTLQVTGGSAGAPGMRVGATDAGISHTTTFTGMSHGGSSVVIGNANDQLYMSGIIAGVGDDIVATGTQIFRVVSSKRFKDVGKRIDKAAIVAKLKALPVYEWAYKNSDEQQIGWMAEDVAEVDPRLVNWNDEGQPSSIRTLAIMAVLT